MKKTLAILLALAMVFSTLTVAFAEDSIGADAQACVTLNMLQGEGTGVTADYLAKAPSRLQAAIMVLRLKGLEDEALAYTGTDNFADANQVAWAGGKAIMGYLKTHPELGWVGDQGKFNPNGTMIAKDYYKVMLETLGYKQNTTEVIGDFTYPGVFEFAAKVGLTKVAAVTNFTNNDVAIATIEALKANVKGTEKTLVATMIDSKALDMNKAIAAGVYTAPVVVPPTAAASSITALNTKQIQVTFNKAVDETTAETESNYVIQGIASGNYTATLLDDATTVILTLNTAQVQGTKLSVSVSNIQDENCIETIPTFFADVTFVDVTNPTITKVEATANKVVTITLSEPVAGLVASDFKLNGNMLGVYGGAVLTPSNGLVDSMPTNQQYTLTFNNTLTAATYSLDFNGAGRVDAAGFPIAKVSNSFVVENITGAPAMAIETAKSGTNGTVKVTFDRVMNSSTLVAGNFSLNVAGANPTGVSVASDKKSVTLTFTSVASGANILLVAPAVADSYGNKVTTSTSNVRLTFTAAADTTAPTLLSAQAINSETVITLKFDEAMDSITGNNNANYVVKDADGNKVAPTSSRSLTPVVGGTGNKTVTVTLGTKLAGGTYTIEVSNLKDTAANVMAATTKAFTITDVTAPTFADKDSVAGGVQAAVYDNVNHTAEIYFNEAMQTTGAFSILDKNNWTYKGAALPAYVQVSAGTSNKSVIFTFGSTDVLASGDTWEILIAKDVTGNLMPRTSATSVVRSLVDTPYIVDGSVQALAGTSSNDQVTFEVDQNLASFDYTQFVVTKGVTPVAVTGGTLVGKVGTLYVADGALGDGTNVTLDVIVNAANANENGGLLDTEDGIALAADDVIAPNMLSVAKAGTTLQVTFNEPLNMNYVGLFKSDFVVDNNGATIVPSSTVAGGSNNVVVLNFASTVTLAGANVVVYPASTVANVKDAANNVWVPTDSEISDGVAATIAGGATAGAVVTTPGSAAVPAVAASLVNQGVTYTAKTAGVAGNAITVALVDPAANNATLGLVDGAGTVTINLATDGSGVITTTAADIAALTSTQVNLAGTGATPVVVLSATNLANGADLVPGVTETAAVTITGAATGTGNVTVTVNGVAHTVALVVGDSTATVASKIVAKLTADANVTGWTFSASGSTITFTSTTAATNVADLTFTMN